MQQNKQPNQQIIENNILPLNQTYNNLSEIKISDLDSSQASYLKLDLETDFSVKNKNTKILTEICTLETCINIGFDSSNSKLIENSMLNNTVNMNSLYKVSNTFILILGGKPDGSTRRYDFDNKKWSENKNILINKYDFASIMYKEKKILILGGKTSVIILF